MSPDQSDMQRLEETRELYREHLEQDETRALRLRLRRRARRKSRACLRELEEGDHETTD